jgi:hypothetical protein
MVDLLGLSCPARTLEAGQATPVPHSTERVNYGFGFGDFVAGAIWQGLLGR